MHAIASNRVIPAKAGTHELGADHYLGRRRSWAPAFAGVTPLFLLTACQQAEAPANNQVAVAPPQKAAPESDVSAAQRLVRARIGGGEVRFLDVSRSASDQVPIVCGQYEQGGRRQRYIVVNREEAFVEPQMRPGEMDRAVAEFCGQGHDNRPPPATPTAENVQ